MKEKRGGKKKKQKRKTREKKTQIVKLKKKTVIEPQTLPNPMKKEPIIHPLQIHLKYYI